MVAACLSSGSGKASIVSCESTVALFVGSIEVEFDLGNGVLSRRELAPVFDCIGKNSSFLEVHDGSEDCGSGSDGADGCFGRITFKSGAVSSGLPWLGWWTRDG